MSQCNAGFDDLAHRLGEFTCQNAPALIHLRNPLALSNWTLPVLELMMVAGAVLALWYSIRRLRRDGDPTNLALWFATVIYLFVVEIPLYFPNVFAVQDSLGVVFAHNVFTVQFLFERLPLYIVALYPAVVTLALEIVRSLGCSGTAASSWAQSASASCTTASTRFSTNSAHSFGGGPGTSTIRSTIRCWPPCR